jgi:hypothetical protein
MFGLFNKRRNKVVEIPLDPPDGLYQGVWEKKRMPSPGAQAYAWETLGLSQFTPIGPGVTVREGYRVTAGADQPMVGLAVMLEGVPTSAGQIYGQPLFDPNVGAFTNSPMPIYNNPYPYSSEPYGGKAT